MPLRDILKARTFRNGALVLRHCRLSGKADRSFVLLLVPSLLCTVGKWRPYWDAFSSPAIGNGCSIENSEYSCGLPALGGLDLKRL